MMLNNEANKIGKVDGESDNETTEQTKDLSEAQLKALNKVKQSIEEGVLSSRYQTRSFTTKATPFMFPDAYSVNQQLFANQKTPMKSTSPPVQYN